MLIRTCLQDQQRNTRDTDIACPVTFICQSVTYCRWHHVLLYYLALHLLLTLYLNMNYNEAPTPSSVSLTCSGHVSRHKADLRNTLGIVVLISMCWRISLKLLVRYWICWHEQDYWWIDARCIEVMDIMQN